MLKVSLLKVDGDSMHPAITSGVFVVVWHWQVAKYRQRLQIGDVVAVEHPRYGKIIKRISALRTASQVNMQGKKQRRVSELRLRGDNELASVSEARMGWVSAENVIGRVIYVVKAKP